MTEISPFLNLRSSHVKQLLESCPQLGQHLLRVDQDRSIRFCSNHLLLDAQAKSTWRLHAALLRFILQPLISFYQRACKLSSIALCDARPRELDLAFRGQARNSFLWLQCLLAEERQWCTTLGCPACSTSRTLNSEMTIRAIITSVLVADVCFQEYDAPDFSSILDALESAVAVDPFWNSMHYPHFLSRSEIIANGFGELQMQCTELDILTSSPPGSSSSVTSGSSFSDDGSDYGSERSVTRRPGANLIKLRPGSIALRQVSLRQEQMMAVAELLSDWTTTQLAES